MSRLLSTPLCRQGIILTGRRLTAAGGGRVVCGSFSLVLSRSLFTSSSSKRPTRLLSLTPSLLAASAPATFTGRGVSSSSPTSPVSAEAPPPPSRKLPYTMEAAAKVSEVILEPVTAAEEGAACPMVLSQVEDDYTLPHPIWTTEQMTKVSVTHRLTESTIDTLAYYVIKTMRFNFDLFTGWMWGVPNKSKVLTRIVFLESVAGVPGSVAATLRHLASLRRMKRDHGWIHTLLEEAENERMHLLTAIELKQPGPVMRFFVFMAQGVWFNFFFLSYLISPRFCHRMVGYLEEEAVKTYTEVVKLIDGRFIEDWVTERPPEIAMKYWKMKEDATMRDLILQIRADEASHREVNHCLADLDPETLNPYRPGHK